MKVIFRPLNSFDKSCKCTLEEFKEEAKTGMYTDDDGHGVYATDTQRSNIYIDFHDILYDEVPEWATHVLWFNK